MLTVGVCLTILSIALVVYLLTGPPAGRVPKERRLAPGETVSTPLEDLVKRLEGTVDWILRKRGWNPFPAATLELAGITMPQSSLVTAVIISSLVALLVGYTLGGALPAVVLALMVPLLARAIINSRKTKRQRAFADQLESTLEVLASALRAGHSLPSALDTVAGDAQSPTDEEFARIVNEGRLGLDIVTAMRATSTRMQSEDFGWVTDAVAIQRRTGGNLSEVLDGVGETIRERNTLAKQVRAISSEGRASAKVMMAMPLLMAAYMFWRNPSTFLPIFTTGTGQLLVGVSAVLYVIGYFWIHKLVNVRV
jgi:tight adherence protein B